VECRIFYHGFEKCEDDNRSISSQFAMQIGNRAVWDQYKFEFKGTDFPSVWNGLHVCGVRAGVDAGQENA